MFPIAELYPLITAKYIEIPEVQQGIVRIAWNYCVGEKIRKVSEASQFHDGVLKVRVTHNHWQTTLNSMKPAIIAKINKYLRRSLLNDIAIELQ